MPISLRSASRENTALGRAFLMLAERPRHRDLGGGGFVLGLGRFAGLQRDCVRGQGPGPKGCGQAGDDVLVREVAPQQQYLDQRPGALGVAVSPDRRGPPGVVDRGELPGRAGLVECGRAGKGTRLADQGFQVVVQLQPACALGDQPLVPGHLDILVVNHQMGGVQQHPDALADQPHRHRVTVGANRDLAVAVDPRREHPSRLERVLRQRNQPRALVLETLVDRPGHRRARQLSSDSHRSWRLPRLSQAEVGKVRIARSGTRDTG
ncbi:hypothetical protein OOK36_46225 [Streptomyces sp. NBC_00365]|uniref:hypothetical protein n=1 Tax=Streptomyces sp. NBC_00365 TaxID=2975726 RepID=UPI002256FA27|nr:hypothetical protein [Streptomyces sp. NBC_00365]MCX5096063.1 hypothetical protein [Streptomyces sp. NBC_00365]